MFHVTDWFTTMLGFAGGNIDALDVDGVDQWDTLVNGGSTCASKTTQRFIDKIIYSLKNRFMSNESKKMLISILGNTLLHNIEVNWRGNVKTATYREGDYKVNHIYLQNKKQ